MGTLVSLHIPQALPPTSYEDGPLDLRKPSLKDVPGLLALINGYAATGIMLPRTEFEMAENIRDFIVISRGDRLVCCSALHTYSPAAARARSPPVPPRLP